MQIKNEFSFTAPLETVKLNHITTAVYLPHHIIVELPKGRQRVSGTINGSPFSLAIQYRRDGSRFFTVGAALRKEARIEAGDKVSVSFRILDFHQVELPRTLESVMHQDSEARQLGKKFCKPGKYAFTEYIRTIKNMDVRLKRSIENVQRSRITTLQPQQNRKNKNR